MQFFLTKDKNGETTDTMLKLVDGDQILFVPKDEGNRHYQMYLAWVAEGNTAYYPSESVAPEPEGE